jgi:hypothetical protein
MQAVAKIRALWAGICDPLPEVPVTSAGRPTSADLQQIANLRTTLSWNMYYINGAETLWYAKAVTAGPARIERQVPTLVLAAMHHLSELCRYRPLQLASHLAGCLRSFFSIQKKRYF